MKMVIAEKAIAGRRIAAILAGKDVPAQGAEKVPVFAFERGGDDYVVVPLRGHIVDVDFPKQYSYWLGTDVRQLNRAEIEYKATEPGIVKELKRLGKEVEEVVVATDADREGESIGMEALRFIQEVNPRVRARRALFSAITEQDIEEAFGKLGDVDANLSDSADARREIDLIWGAVLTRFISLISGRLGKEFLSAGRVQTPTLGLVVAREAERRAFKAEKYWVLEALLEKGGKPFLAEHKKGRFAVKLEAEKAFARKAKNGTVVNVASSRRRLKKPLPFNTTDFLRAATATGFGAGEAMNHAETLYQMGFTSYPRTDNKAYPKTLDLRKVLSELAKVDDLKDDVEKVLALGKLEPSQGKESKDHPPIHPVTAAPKSKLSARQWKIYELICRRFLATLSEDAETLNMAVDVSIAGEPYVARGQRIEKPGWKAVYPYSQLKEVLLPELVKGDIVEVKKLAMDEKETQPPARYSQGSLIKLMEDNGLGTKATRHEIIRKLYARQYIGGLKTIEPNEIGFGVTAVLEEFAPLVTKPEMTAELEKEMDLVAAGRKSKEDVVNESRDFLAKLLVDLVGSKDRIGAALREALRSDAVVGRCDKCEGHLRKIKSRNNKWFLGCTNYPKCTNTYPLPQKGSVVAANKECAECGKPMVKVLGARYRFEMCVDMDCPSKDEWKKRRAEKEAGQRAGGMDAATAGKAVAKGTVGKKVGGAAGKKPEKKKAGQKSAAA